MRTSALALTAFSLLALGACATFEEAYGRPDPLDWTYFEGEPGAVVEALGDAFLTTGIRVESVRSEAGGTIMTLSSRAGTADFTEVLVQPSTEEGFASRAQVYPVGRPLPRWLEMEVSGRI